MDGLHAAVRQVLAFHPHTVTNYISKSSSLSDAARINMTKAAEELVSQLLSVLSRGLHDEVHLWTVLETLECVPSRVAREEIENPLRQIASRLKFCSQLVHTIKSTLAQSTTTVCARALIRLALSQGCLLAALELIAQWNAEELHKFYFDPSVSVLCSINGELWDSFLSACAPVGGVMLAEIQAGVPRGTSVVKFDLKMVLSGFGGVDGKEEEGSMNKIESGEGYAVDVVVRDTDDRPPAVSGESVYRSDGLNGSSSASLARSAKQPVALVTPIPLSDEGRRRRKKKRVKKVKAASVNEDQNNSNEPEETSTVNVTHRGLEETRGGDDEEEGDDEREEVENKEAKLNTNDEDSALKPMHPPGAFHNKAEDSRSETLNGDAKSPSAEESRAAEAVSLLDKAEQILWRRWKCISSAIAAQEAVILAQADESSNVS